MTRDDIIKLAREAGLVGLKQGGVLENFERFAALVAAEKEQQMIRDGWRQCAEGQKTTQYCGLLDAAVKAEREACAKVAESFDPNMRWSNYGLHIANAIRARGET